MNLRLAILRRVHHRTIVHLIYLIWGVIVEHDVVFADDGSAISSSVWNERHLILLVIHLLLGASVLCVFLKHVVNFVHIFVIWLFLWRILISWSVISTTSCNGVHTIFVRWKFDAINIKLLGVMCRWLSPTWGIVNMLISNGIGSFHLLILKVHRINNILTLRVYLVVGVSSTCSRRSS